MRRVVTVSLTTAVLALAAQAAAARTHLDDVFRALGAKVTVPDGVYPLYTLPGKPQALTFAAQFDAQIPAGDTAVYPNGTAVGRVGHLTLISNRTRFEGDDLRLLRKVLGEVASRCFNLSPGRFNSFEPETAWPPVDNVKVQIGPLTVKQSSRLERDGHMTLLFTLWRSGMPGSGVWKNYCSVMVS